MEKLETAWKQNSDWKARYSKLYSSQRISLPREEPCRISFMSNGLPPNQSLLMRSQSYKSSGINTPSICSSLLSQRSDPYRSSIITNRSDTLGGHETMLLDMVRAQSKELQKAQQKSLDLPNDDDSEDQSTDACMHGFNMRFTERSVSISRSRFSRISTKRDMDIPSILAFATHTTDPIQLEIPAFQKTKQLSNEDAPRWSIRRSVCPVCSQKWKDRSAITNVKYSGEYFVKFSGLKRNSSSELPTVIAPARLRASITMAYEPRPTLAVVDEEVPGYRLLRNTSATWQLTRARRFRTPKPKPPPPEATAPPSAAAPLARKDLDIRVNKFLANK